MWVLICEFVNETHKPVLSSQTLWAFKACYGNSKCVGTQPYGCSNCVVFKNTPATQKSVGTQSGYNEVWVFKNNVYSKFMGTQKCEYEKCVGIQFLVLKLWVRTDVRTQNVWVFKFMGTRKLCG